jgi:hypothetical protein
MAAREVNPASRALTPERCTSSSKAASQPNPPWSGEHSAGRRTGLAKGLEPHDPPRP